MSANPFAFLLPYQTQWVWDRSRFKIWLKSRQIGGSLAAAFEIVDDAISNGGDWIILSAGERQALEFMEKVKRITSLFQDALSQSAGQPWLPKVQAEKITLPNGARIFALPANPATARGYSGNVLLDEFAFHEKPGEIWKAVYPIITNPLKGKLKLRIVSTPAGKNSKFYDLWQNGQDFARHKTDVYDAVNDGLGIEVEQLRANLDDPDAWAQEYECNFMEASDQLFPPDLVRAAEHTAATIEWPGKPHNALFCGIDIGRYRDLTVAWTLERVGDTLWTREILTLQETPYHEQEEILAPRIARAAHVSIDATGIGGPVAESLANQLGEHKLSCINFNNNTKRELFARMKKAIGSGSIRIPADNRLRDDITSLHRIVTPQGVVKYSAARTRDGHADRATALALALDAASKLPASHGIARFPMILGHLKQSYRPRRTKWRMG